MPVCFCYEEFQKSVIQTEMPPQRIGNPSVMSVIATICMAAHISGIDGHILE